MMHYYAFRTVILASISKKNLNDVCVSQKYAAYRCGLLVDYCDVFISCLNSHYDRMICFKANLTKRV